MSIKNRAGDFAIFMLFILIFCFSCVLTAPAPTVQLYNKFLAHVTANKCYWPKNIKPFSPSAVGWYFLSEPLSQCNIANATFETTTLCTEIFENFINTTCTVDPKLSIPKISYELSSKVCNDFAEYDKIIPKIEGFVGGDLVDRTICQLACASQYEILCKVLLWSYQVRQHIEATIESAQRENDLNHPVQSQINSNPVAQNQNDLNSLFKSQDVINNPQKEVKLVENQKDDPDAVTIAEENKKVLKDSKLTNDIANQVFDAQRVIIPNFPKNDEESPSPIAITEPKIKETLSTMKDSTTSGFADNNGKVNAVEMTKSNEIVNEHESGENTQLSSLTSENKNHDIGKTVGKNQTETSNVESSTFKDKLKAKLKEKKEKKKALQASTNTAVNDIKATSHDTETNTGVSTFDVVMTEKLPMNESSQSELKGIEPVRNDTIETIESDPANKLVHEASNDKKKGENVESSNLNDEKIVTATSSTNHNLIKITQPNSGSGVITTSTETEVSKSSDQQNSGKLTDNSKDITSSAKMEVKSTVDSQGKEINLTGESSDVPNLESTTLEVTLEEMDNANELPPPVQGQDQYNDLENGDTEGEYDRPDYAPDGALPHSTEPKKVVAQDSFITSEKTAAFSDQQNDFSQLYSDLIPKSFDGQVSGDIRRIPAFPEEEDGHFFFYFLSVILILMIGYLIFHNKQKIIALIVEGRHERRRRSYGAGYKKLDTK